MNKGLGIEEIKRLITFVTGLTNLSAKTFEDGKLTWTDMVHASDFIKLLYLFIEIDFRNAKVEFEDLSPAEKAELFTLFEEQLNLPFDKAEELTEACFKLAMNLYSDIQDLMKLYKKISD